MINLLPVRNDYVEFINKPIEFLIDNTYSVVGHPTIVSGLLKSGTIKINELLVIGPFFDGSYREVKIRSIHCKFNDIKEAKAGNYICLSLTNIQRKDIKKGMVLISNQSKLKLAVKNFWAHITILHSSTTIKIGYTPFVHIDQVRQSVTITEIKKITNDKIGINSEHVSDPEENILRTGDKAYIKLEFIIKPEYIKPNMKLIFREGKVKAVGRVIDQDTELL